MSRARRACAFGIAFSTACAPPTPAPRGSATTATATTVESGRTAQTTPSTKTSTTPRSPRLAGRVLDAPRGAPVGVSALLQGMTAISADRQFVALPARSFADDCEQVHVIFAPIGSVDGDRVLVRATGTCSPDVMGKVADADADARLARDGFASLGIAGGFPKMQLGEVDVDWTSDAKGLDAEASVGKTSLGKTHFARQPGSSSTGGVLAVGERSVVYVSVAFETSKPGPAVPHGRGPGLATRSETWAAIPLASPPPIEIERLGGGEVDASASAASRATGKTCATGAVEKRASFELHRCDGGFRVLDPRGTTIIEGTADVASNVSLSLYSADLTGLGEYAPMPCVEVDGATGDALRCVDASGANVADLGGGRLSFAFFLGPPPGGASTVTSYLRVISFTGATEKVERIAFDGKRFPAPKTLPGVTGP